MTIPTPTIDPAVLAQVQAMFGGQLPGAAAVPATPVAPDPAPAAAPAPAAPAQESAQDVIARLQGLTAGAQAPAPAAEPELAEKPEPAEKPEKRGRGRPKTGNQSDRIKLLIACAEGGLAPALATEYLALLADL